MHSGPRPSPLTDPRLARALGVLLALPALVLAWPRPSLVRGLFEPEVAAAGVAALAALPAIALAALARRAPAPAGLAPFAAFLAACAVSLCVLPPSDTQEADRALLVLGAGFALYLAAAGAGAQAGRALARAAACATLAFALAALFDRAGRYAGVLGNTGATSAAALAGALCGAWLFAGDGGAWRWIGLAALLAEALYAGFAPVIAGALSLALGLGASLALARGARVPLALALVLALGAAGFGRALAQFPRPSAKAAPGLVAPDLGGASVRARVWGTLPSFLADHWALGAGPGQFRASYPPYRDPAEIDIERRALGVDVETEVEHGHNDWLQGFGEAGFFAGLAWLVFLGWTALHAVRALRAGDAMLAAPAAAVLGLLANACVRAPLFANAASSTLFFACAGVLAARVPGPRVAWAARILPWIALTFLVARSSAALALVQSQRALAPSPAAAPDPGAALAARADVPLALTLAARGEAAAGRAAEARAAWERQLRLRPHSFEAWMQLGVMAANAGDVAEARYRWRRALALDPHHPRLLFDLALLELRHGDDAALDAALADLAAAGALDPRTLALAGAQEILAGRQRGLRFVAAAEPRARGRSPDEIADLATALRREQRALEGDALECWAQREFARGHANARAWHDAVRSYRQALRLAKSHGAGDAGSLALEYAAALALDERVEEARAEIDGAAWSADELAECPPWTAEALRAAGIVPR